MSCSTEKGFSDSHQRVIQEILHYLIEHPNAKDTIEGILRWWLPKDQVGRQTEVQEVLDFLIGKGWLTERELAPSQKIYGLNKNRLKEVKGLLDQLEGKAEEINVQSCLGIRLCTKL